MKDIAFSIPLDWDEISPELRKRYGAILDNFDMEPKLLIEVEYDPGTPGRFDGHPDSRYPAEPDGLDSLEIVFNMSVEGVIEKMQDGMVSSASAKPVFTMDALRIIGKDVTKNNTNTFPYTADRMIRFIGAAVAGWVAKNHEWVEAQSLEKCREEYEKMKNDPGYGNVDPDYALEQRRDRRFELRGDYGGTFGWPGDGPASTH